MARQVEALARHMARWHVIGKLAGKNENLTRFWHVGTQERWHVNCTNTLARWHVNHAGTGARWHIESLGTRFSKLDDKCLLFIKIF